MVQNLSVAFKFITEVEKISLGSLSKFMCTCMHIAASQPEPGGVICLSDVQCMQVSNFCLEGQLQVYSWLHVEATGMEREDEFAAHRL